MTVGDAELARPGPVLGVLHQLWLERRPVVVELGVDPNALKVPQRFDGPVHDLTPDFEFEVERLHFLVWANNYDARSGEPIWWHGRKAARTAAAGGLPSAVRLTSPWPTAPPCSSTAVPRTLRPSLRGRRGAPVGRRVRSSRSGDPRRIRAELAPDQLAAVGHRSGAARVIAPAGSGKTRVLTERLRHLVAGRGAQPGR